MSEDEEDKPWDVFPPEMIHLEGNYTIFTVGSKLLFFNASKNGLTLFLQAKLAGKSLTECAKHAAHVIEPSSFPPDREATKRLLDLCGGL